METNTETLALAFGEDIRPITPEERKFLRRKIRKDKAINWETRRIFELIDILSLKYGFCWASSRYIAGTLSWPEEYIKLAIRRLRKRKYVLVSKVRYQSSEYDKNRRIQVMALNYKKAQEEN